MSSVSQANFLSSPEAVYARRALTVMEADPDFETPTSFTMLTADNKLTFANKHMNYLSKHTSLDPMQYISNLKLMTRRTK